MDKKKERAAREREALAALFGREGKKRVAV
jgi:hypothetical protein